MKNVAMLTEDRVNLPSFSLQWESATQRKKNADARGSARGGGGLGAAGID